MKKNTESYSHTDLSKYGLNPLHWFLSDWNKKNPHKALMTHIDDPDFNIAVTFRKEEKEQTYRIIELCFAY